MDELEYPPREENLVRYLSVRYSNAEELVETLVLPIMEKRQQKKMLAEFSGGKTGELYAAVHNLNSVDKICESLKNQGVKVETGTISSLCKT